MKTTRKIGAILSIAVLGMACARAWPGAAPAQAPGTSGGSAVPADPWPRETKLGDATARMYQPQIESWEGNRLTFRAVVVIKPAGSKPEVVGVIWGTVRTQVDRVSRIVALEDLTLTRSDFPMLPDRGASYLRTFQKQFVPVQRTIALDRLEASLAASGALKAIVAPVKNEPPRIIVSESPAILVPIAGSPVLRPVPGTKLDRVINTQALILRPQGSGPFYLHVYDGWLHADAIEGPWGQPFVLPSGIDQVARNLAKSGEVDLLDGTGVTPKPSLAQGVPTIYVSDTPAELLVFKGPPSFTPIAGTTLRWAANTTADVLLDPGDNAFYVLLSGRWYRAPALGGPWSYVPSTSLPADFQKIPADSPVGVVLASVAGTPQAEEAVIANSIPQTATVPRVNGPTFSPVFDGTAQLRPIETTPLQYVVNSPVPVIRVDATTYYALQAGVWFSATSLSGPWVVATSVPAVIYTIPPASPLYYVTYVRVYGSTAQVVYVGYTPGYLGTVVTPEGVVVYGTGYVYQPWIGTVYYAVPVTYGLAAQPVYNPAVGMAFGFAMGVTTAALVGEVYYHPAYYGYPCCGSTSANVYGHYGSTSWSGTRSWYSTSGGTVGTSASGSYTNDRTGTTGTYEGGRAYNPYTGQAAQGYERTFTTPGGTTGSVARGESYNAATGRYAYGSGTSATGPGGTQVTRDTAATTSPSGSAAAHQTTVTNPSGQTSTVGTATVGNDHYADVNGQVYKNTGSGWQQYGSSGWQSASGDTSWASREQQARGEGEARWNSFQQSGGASQWSGGSNWASRFGGGGGRFGGFRR